MLLCIKRCTYFMGLRGLICDISPCFSTVTRFLKRLQDAAALGEPPARFQGHEEEGLASSRASQPRRFLGVF